MVADEALVLMIATVVAGADVVPRNVDSVIGLGLKMIVPGLMVKLNENAGEGPPPGNGFVIVPDTGPAVVRNEAGTATSKTVPPALAVPPVSGILPREVSVTVVLFTKFDPVKCSVYGVPAVVVGFVSVGVPRMGFITVNGPEPESAPCGSVSET